MEKDTFWPKLTSCLQLAKLWGHQTWL